MARTRRGGAAAAARCSQTTRTSARAGRARAFVGAPRGGALAWSPDGVPAAEGLECVAAPAPGGGTRACCRATLARAELLADEYPAHFARIARSAARAEGVNLVTAATTWRCFPSLVIVGAQKSGSTALAVHLTRHPSIAFSRDKELHFFDKNESLCPGPLGYLLKFPPRDELKATAEATPFYIASTEACIHMAAQLGRRATYVLIVREPVARAYSEYQMKHRRVQGQDGFEKALQAHAGAILRCVAEAGPRNATRGLRACAPAELQALAKFPQFAASVGVQIARKAKAAKQAGGDDRSALYEWLKACFWVADEGTKEPLADLIGGGRGAARFDATQCFKEGTRERLGDLEAVMRDEVALFHDCARTHFSWMVPPSMEAAADLITKCVRVRTGISAQYLYRGLYAAQLQRCLRGGVVSSDIVVVDQDVLRRDPQRALDAVSVNLPRHTYEDLSDASLKAEMERRWPDFEKSRLAPRRGLHGADALGPRSELARFFAPHNELLFDFVGRRFDWPARRVRCCVRGALCYVAKRGESSRRRVGGPRDERRRDEVDLVLFERREAGDMRRRRGRAFFTIFCFSEQK